MAGEETTTTTETTEQTTATAETQQSVVETQQTQPKPHPLEPGGERWNEIYRERSEYKRETEALRAENERLRTQQTKPADQQRVYTEAELQAAVDRGQITPAQMASQIALQAATAAERRIEARNEERTRAQSAVSEVNEYLAKVPALKNSSSKEFQQVTAEAHRIAGEINLPVTDARVQRLACAAALGPIERIATVEKARDFNRQHADTHSETGGGGGSRTPQNDPLKNVEPERLRHWERLGYSREAMIEEAKHIKRPIRAR